MNRLRPWLYPFPRLANSRPSLPTRQPRFGPNIRRLILMPRSVVNQRPCRVACCHQMFSDLAGRIVCLPQWCPPPLSRCARTNTNVQQSTRVQVKDREVLIGCLTRSSVNSERDDLANALCAGFELTGGDVQMAGAYTGWRPAPESAIVALMSGLYEELFGDPPHVSACHGGLECGILGQNYPDIDMISFGPNICGPHSPDERVQISSVQKCGLLLETYGGFRLPERRPNFSRLSLTRSAFQRNPGAPYPGRPAQLCVVFSM